MVEKKSGASTALINMLDESGQQGKVQLRSWGPNKKNKECTIQVYKVKSEDVKYVKNFADTFLKHALEEAIRGNNIKFLFRNLSPNLSSNTKIAIFKCDTCDKTFQHSRTLKMHVTRMHKTLVISQVQLRKSKPRIRCIYCNIPFSEDNLKTHIDNNQSCTLCEVM